MYNNDTKIYFCCDNLRGPSSPIVLPTERPFYLIASEGPECQEVYGTLNKLEEIVFDTEDTNNQNSHGGQVPVGAANGPHPTISYCYYEGMKLSLDCLLGEPVSPTCNGVLGQ